MPSAAESAEPVSDLPRVESTPTAPPPAPPEPPAAPGAAGLLLAWILPQLLLLALNWGDARLLLQAANPQQAAALWTYAGVWLAVFAVGVGGLGGFAWRRQPVPWPALLAMTALPLGLKFFYELQAGRFWPENLAPWMLSTANVDHRQSMLLLIPCYVAAIGLLRLQMGARTGRWVASAALGAGLVGSLLASMYLARPDFRPLFYLVGLAAGAVGIVISALPPLLRRRYLVAGGFPLLGLCVNAAFPFPANFQRVAVYVLLLVNAVVICWPEPTRPDLRRALWLARCAMLPFTAYFFALLLPWLGFWMIGLVVYGGGALVLAPLALANLHFPLIATGWREHCSAPRSTATALAAVGAMCLLPVSLIGLALAEKSNLDRALRGIAYPELRAGALPMVDAPQLRRTLELGAFADRRGQVDLIFSNQLPLVDDLRRQLVLGGLALPAALRADLAAAFLPEQKAPKAPAPRPRLEPDQSGYVHAREVTTTSLAGAPGWEETKVRLVLRMGGRVDGEWLARLRLPTDAFVTDHALVIDGQRVPSRVVDRNTALFIYERISRADRPRDPGLIHYVGPEEVELRVFPIPRNGERVTDLTITHRAGAAGLLRLAGEPLAESAPADAPSRWVATAAGAALFPARGALEKYAFVRPPVRWVLADGTAPVPPREQAAAATWRAGRGLERTTQRIGLRESDEPLWPPALLGRIVLAEFLRESAGQVESRLQLDWISRRPAPAEIEGFARTLSGDFAFTGDETARPVAVLRCGGVVRAVAPDAATVWFDAASSGASIEVYDRSQQRFVTLESEREGSPRIAALAEAMLVSRERELHPERFRQHSRRLWKVARDARVLTPQTAFLVVESAAQWAILEKKEKERENAPDTIESPVSIPEPRTWALLAAGGVALAVARWRRRR
ncbi:MAG: MSEP-CTERM sorting domain-containing protein [Verrucomicrobia bacterium]|nr:MSEP-CTERM sorting domain-containing protein [Verrucomicrobiota bacterium]